MQILISEMLFSKKYPPDITPAIGWYLEMDYLLKTSGAAGRFTES
jgi:hypothetical protein